MTRCRYMDEYMAQLMDKQEKTNGIFKKKKGEKVEPFNVKIPFFKKKIKI